MKKQLGSKDLFTIALGSVIGWGAFVLPGNVFLAKAGVINTLIGFTIAVLMIFFIEKSYSLLLGIYPSVGGEYTFARKTFGRKVGFSTGWLLTLAYLSIIPLNATAVPMVLESITDWYSRGSLLYSFANYPVYLNDICVSLFIIILFTFINYKGVRSSKLAQNICVFGLLIAIITIVILSGGKLDSSNYYNLKSNMGEVDWKYIIRIVAFAPWAFIGFDTIAQMSEEFKVDSKKASFSALIAVVFGAAVYNILNIYTALGVPNSELSSVSWATGFAVSEILGPMALGLLAIAMFGAVISGLNGFFMGSSRLLFAMIDNEKLTKSSSFDIKKITILVGALSCIVPFFGRNSLIWFVDLSSVGASFAYLITCLAAYRLAEKNRHKIYAFLGSVFSVMFLVFLLTPFFESNIPLVSAICLVIWIALGMFLYFRLYLLKVDKVLD